ncbi:MAG: pantetheine-phosphate adenylyltransferase [Verrucomicrobiales bacterium]|nr:pantetheine-phosphate adenylyltransferase [Verrucomicrobiales bacterium]
MQKAIYPGSFDPLHNGHIDVIGRAARLCDEVVVSVATNSAKNALLSIAQRIDIIQDATSHIPGVTVTQFEGLLVDFVIEQKADCIIRGLRAISDFEYEFQMALMNRQLRSDVETIFLMPSQEHIYLSSRIIKEIAGTGNDVRDFISEKAALAVEEKLQLKK